MDEYVHWGVCNASQSLWIISDNTVLLTCKYSSWCPTLLLFGKTQPATCFSLVGVTRCFSVVWLKLQISPDFFYHFPLFTSQQTIIWIFKTEMRSNSEAITTCKKNSWSPFWHLTEDLSPCMMNTKICGEEFGSTFETILVDIHTFSGTSCTRSPLGDFERSPLRDISWSF